MTTQFVFILSEWFCKGNVIKHCISEHCSDFDEFFRLIFQSLVSNEKTKKNSFIAMTPLSLKFGKIFEAVKHNQL